MSDTVDTFPSEEEGARAPTARREVWLTREPHRFSRATWIRWRNPGVIALAVTIVMARRVSFLMNPAFALEDGTIFFGEQLRDGYQPFKVYNGALYVGQRTVAFVLSLLPMEVQPRLYYLVACTLVVLPLWFLLGDRCSTLLGPWRWRASLVVFLVVAPGWSSPQGTLTYMHWWWAVPFAVVLATSDPTTAARRFWEIAFLVAVGLSGFGAVFLIPLALWMAVRSRSTHGYVRLGVVVACSVVQLVVLATSTRDNGPRAATEVARVAPYIVNRWVSSTFLFGESNTLAYWTTNKRPVFIVGALAFSLMVIAITALDWRGPSPWWLLGAGGLTLAGFYSAPMVEILAMQMGYPIQERYFATVISLVALIVFRTAATSWRALARIAAIAAICISSIGVVSDVKTPQWAEQPGAISIGEFKKCLEEKLQDVCELTGFPDWHILVPTNR